MSVLFVLPVLDGEAADACIASMDLWEFSGYRRLVDGTVNGYLLVVDNTMDGYEPTEPHLRIHRAEPHGATGVTYEPACNLGVAGSFNLAAETMLAEGHSHFVWVSTSLRFGATGGRDVLDACADAPYGFATAVVGLHCWGVGRAMVERIGLMDMNLWPGYWDDSDYIRRGALAGIHLPTIPLDVACVRDGHGYDVLRAANPDARAINFDAIKAYYAAKWGSEVPGEETFDHPWNDPTKPLDWWPPVTRAELVERYRLGQ